MRCRAAKKITSRYLGGELSSTERTSLEKHLTECTACQAEYAAQRYLWDLLVRVEPIQAPDVIAAVEARLSERRGWTTLLAGLRLRTVSYAAATAVLVGLFVWTGVWAGISHRPSAAGEPDRAFAELMSDTPPGMEILVVIEEIGERP